MFRSRKYADKPSKDDLKTFLRLLRRQFGDRWLLADDMTQFRHELDEQQFTVSTNGIVVDGQHTQRATLRDGSRIVMGSTTIVYRQAEG